MWDGLESQSRNKIIFNAFSPDKNDLLIKMRMTSMSVKLAIWQLLERIDF